MSDISHIFPLVESKLKLVFILFDNLRLYTKRLNIKYLN